jgi:PAS domain S-box-containing protein
MAEPLRILILEDNSIDTELVQFELQEAGLAFNSNVVKTEKDFVRELQDYCPDLILSEYDLPQYNGALALAEARRRCPDTPFILVTGAVSEDRAIEILTQGAKDYVLKTRLQQRLVPAVRRALAEAEEHRARQQAEAELREAHRNLEKRVKIRTAELHKEIAERKKLEEELRESEERYRVLFEGSTQGILAADIETKQFVFANSIICRMLRYSEGELLQLGIADLHPKDALGYVLSEFESVARGVKQTSSSVPFLRKDGTVFYADGAGSNTIVRGRRCSVGFFVDVTDRQLMENDLAAQARRLAKTNEELLEANRRLKELDVQKSNVLGLVAHNLQTPPTPLDSKHLQKEGTS